MPCISVPAARMAETTTGQSHNGIGLLCVFSFGFNCVCVSAMHFSFSKQLTINMLGITGKYAFLLIFLTGWTAR